MPGANCTSPGGGEMGELGGARFHALRTCIQRVLLPYVKLFLVGYQRGKMPHIAPHSLSK